MFDKIFQLGLRDILDSMPAEYVTLKEAMDGKLEITLNNGFKHKFDPDEVKKLSSAVPLYLWSMVRIPFIVVKLSTPGEYSINGSEWDMKAISSILNISGNVISVGQMESLLREFKSLIFITLGYDSISVVNEEKEGI
ncbi:hypothetical protein L3N51_01112 [Metallosphaera sp. J1]|uniref:DUF61 family protein n=1 Tax=Metallosphaera TaxID=41980 RepID=UPI001EE08E81|nr:DUF61 family protein [Metallosphaera javensis (ex Hofmann et al. 2022)]MCG3108824.1 hypothetical protein [Metallosphaera javensis (ex Hofmann et al. 2022)]BCS94243.1 MAG: hypothetical protein MjAS7_2851 [Metallosphaera javensis (ex Sakai et al. 2022)]